MIRGTISTESQSEKIKGGQDEAGRIELVGGYRAINLFEQDGGRFYEHAKIIVSVDIWLDLWLDGCISRPVDTDCRGGSAELGCHESNLFDVANDGGDRCQKWDLAEH